MATVGSGKWQILVKKIEISSQKMGKCFVLFLVCGSTQFATSQDTTLYIYKDAIYSHTEFEGMNGISFKKYKRRMDKNKGEQFRKESALFLLQIDSINCWENDTSSISCLGERFWFTTNNSNKSYDINILTEESELITSSYLPIYNSDSVKSIDILNLLREDRIHKSQMIKLPDSEKIKVGSTEFYCSIYYFIWKGRNSTPTYQTIYFDQKSGIPIQIISWWDSKSKIIYRKVELSGIKKIK